MELLCLGDSLVLGFGVPPKQRWLTVAAQESGWSILNRGVSGDTTGGMLVRLREQLAARPDPDAVLLMGGTNDIFYSGSDLCARANMGAMLQQLLAAGLRPLVGLPVPFLPERCPEDWAGAVDFHAAAALLEGYTAWLCRFCGAFGIQTLDFPADLTDSAGTPLPELYGDGLHPNAEGQHRMAARLCAVLRELRRERPDV